MKMNTDRKTGVIAIVAICIAVAGLGIAYATLQQQLTINATVTKKAAEWDVHFANMSAATLNGAGVENAAANLTATNVTVDVSVMKPGDSVTYTFDVVNGGDIDAKLNAIPTITGVTEAAAAYIDVALVYADDNSALGANDELLHGESTTLKLSVTYRTTADPVADAASLATADTDYTIAATLLYVQK